MSIIYEKDGKIAIFKLNRPQSLNSLDIEMYTELSTALIDFKDDDNLWVGILTGVGEKAFCAGADIKTMVPWLIKMNDQPWAEPPTIMKGLKLWKPIIAAVNGIALGGGLELALACDIIIASENAKFGAPEVTLGVMPAWGGTQRLPRAIPLKKAAEMLLIGKTITAEEAYHIGLVNKVVQLSDLMSETKLMAEAMLQAGPLAVRAVKQAMLQGLNMSQENGVELERLLYDYVVSTEDFKCGIESFHQKTRPDFKAK